MDSSSASDASQSSLVYLCPTTLAPTISESKETKTMPRRVIIFRLYANAIISLLRVYLTHLAYFAPNSWVVDAKLLLQFRPLLHEWVCFVNQVTRQPQLCLHRRLVAFAVVRVSTGMNSVFVSFITFFSI